ncbi:ABC transporter permease [Bacillus gobiensis]|uniref:ABC transporter permease n=1 Tax=Bacillus gobiensis TaxID=1441095 RepID=UPI003D245299
MNRLIRNEHKKLFKKRIVVVALISMAVLQFLMALFIKRLLMSARVEDHFIGYFSYAPNLNIILQLFSVVIAATIVSSEFDKRTIKFLLIRPVKRWKILLSKWTTSILASIYLFIVYYSLTLVYGLVFFGVNIDDRAGVLFSNTLIWIASQWLEIFMMIAFAFLCSALLRNSVFSLVVSFVVIYIAKTMVTIFDVMENQWGKFLLFANTDFRQYAGGVNPLFDGTSPVFSIFIIAIHLITFLTVTWWSFCKRDVTV